jgi:hypothetical protein
MIFLFNGAIDDLETFRGFIASIKLLPFSSVVFKYSSPHRDEVSKILNSAFPDIVSESDKINETQSDWQRDYKDFDDDLIWVCSKYDHYFVDSDVEHLQTILDFRREGGTDKLASIHLSNWLDSLKRCVIIDHGKWDGKDHTAPTQAWMTVEHCDSYQIATKALYKSWWFDSDYGDELITSPEELAKKTKLIRPWKVQVPSRELFRPLKKIKESEDFISETVDKKVKKDRLVKYYFSSVSLNSRCLANPRFEPGIFRRVMRHYGFNKTT